MGESGLMTETDVAFLTGFLAGLMIEFFFAYVLWNRIRVRTWWLS